MGISLDAPGWDHSTFTKNRDRLLQTDIARLFFSRVVERARKKKFLSDEHFTVDDPLIEAWASRKSFQPKNPEEPNKGGSERSRNPHGDFHGEQRNSATHESRTARETWYTKSEGFGVPGSLYMGHVLMENRNGLAVDIEVTQASGKAERSAALKMAKRLAGTLRLTVGADKGYAAKEFATELREMNITPHIARRKRGKAIDGRTTRHEG